jgi:hypothetical protein
MQIYVPKNNVQTKINVNTLSWPGLTSSLRPPWRYLAGRPLQLIAYIHADVRSVDVKNSAKPSQFSSPSIPATAPEKHDDKNLTVVRV